MQEKRKNREAEKQRKAKAEESTSTKNKNNKNILKQGRAASKTLKTTEKRSKQSGKQQQQRSRKTEKQEKRQSREAESTKAEESRKAKESKKQRKNKKTSKKNKRNPQIIRIPSIFLAGTPFSPAPSRSSFFTSPSPNRPRTGPKTPHFTLAFSRFAARPAEFKTSSEPVPTTEQNSWETRALPWALDF